MITTRSTQFVLLSLCFISAAASAQENLPYQLPPAEILELADYVRPPSVMTDSKAEYMILSFRSTYKTLEDLSQEEVRLGGLRINPTTNISSTVTYNNNIKVLKTSSGEETQVTGLPESPQLANYRWSPDESKLAFTHTASN